MNPPLKILKSTISIMADEIPIDYEIHFDVTGKVYEMKPLIFNLPESAQQIMLGSKANLLKQQINSNRYLYSVLLPLVISGKVEVTKGISKLLHIIDAEIKLLEIEKSKIYEYAEKGSYSEIILTKYMQAVDIDEHHRGTCQGFIHFILK